MHSPSEYIWYIIDANLLPGKPVYVPIAKTFCVLNYNLKGIEIQGCDSIKSDVEKNERPFKKGIGRISYRNISEYPRAILVAWLTSGNTVDFVLDEEIHHEGNNTEESCGKVLSVFYGLRIGRAQCDATDGPRYGCD